MSFYSNDSKVWRAEIREALEHQTKLGVILQFVCNTIEEEHDQGMWLADQVVSEMYVECTNIEELIK